MTSDLRGCSSRVGIDQLNRRASRHQRDLPEYPLKRIRLEDKEIADLLVAGPSSSR